mmetsp:Transcript_10707/g.25531  ORF Transcript_10707/g.25531 Transcript_10707/m.25531 type:complete len:214 (-) Transcript_10707:927-1568(-)
MTSISSRSVKFSGRTPVSWLAPIRNSRREIMSPTSGGIGPKNVFPDKSKLVRPSKFPSSVGSSPLNALFIKFKFSNDNTLKSEVGSCCPKKFTPASKFRSMARPVNISGIVPVKKFDPTPIVSTFERRPISEGRFPVNWLMEILKKIISVICPIVVGKAPLRVFRLMSNDTSDVIENNSDGKSPVKKFPCSCRFRRTCSCPTSVGMFPEMKLV